MTPLQLIRDRLEITAFADEIFGENCYLVRRRDTDSALIIDPGLQAPAVLRHLERERLTVAQILLTHGHIDHLAGVPALRGATSAPVAMHGSDRGQLRWDFFGSLPFIPDGFQPFEIDSELSHGSNVAFHDVRLQVLHTPGHTEGSVCFAFGLDCFSGDTLFQRSIGRTDLPGGSSEKIVASIRSVLYGLDRKTTVHPGHGPRTTIEEERLLNPFVPALESR